MSLKNEIGNRGELQAVNFLFANGYQVLERNYRFGRSEIDIIAKKDNILIFVEVKARKNTDYGHPETFVSEAQKERIFRAAEEYINQKAWRGPVRFDIIAIIWDSNPQLIDHFEDAF